MKGRAVAGILVVLSLAATGTSAAVAPPTLKWQRGGCFSSWCQTGWYSSPAVADLDGDGSKEILWGSYDLVALDGATGALRARAASSNRVWPGVAVADLTGDGTLEVVVGRSSDQVTVYRPSGGGASLSLLPVWTRSPFGSGEVRTLAVDDLDGDGRLEIVAGRASGGSTRQLDVFDADGNVRPGWPARRDGEPGYGWGMYNQNVAIGDLDSDGLKELIGPTDTHYITALDRNGGQLRANAMYGAGKVWSQVGVHVDHAVDLRGYANCGAEHRPNFANSSPAIGDLDGDGAPEIVVVGNVYNCGTDPYTSLYEMPFVLERDRSRWSGSGHDWTAIPPPGPGTAPLSEDYDVIESAAPNAVLADLDGDGEREILYPSYDGKLHAYWLDKTEHGSWPYDVPGSGFRFASEPVVADLDADGRAEVLFASWPQKGGTAVGQVHVLDYLGNPLHAIDLPPSFPSGSWNGGLAAPTLANIDGDPDLELVVGTAHSGVVAYDLPGTSLARIHWGTGRGSYRRTALAPPLPPPPSRPQPLWHPFFAVDTLETPMTGDFNGDGRTDVITFTRQNPLAVGDVYVALSNGSQFVDKNGNPGNSDKWHDWFAISTAEQVVIGDYDGDGRDDIATWLGTTTRQVYVALSHGTGMGQETVWLNRIGFAPSDVLLAGDANGDGREDLILFARLQGKVYVALSEVTRFGAPAPWHGFFAVSTHERPRVADVDGDGRADIVTFATDSPTAFGDVYVATSDGSRFVDLNGLPNSSSKWHDWFAIRPEEQVRVGDLDADGRVDFFTFLPPPFAQCYTVLSQGTSMAANVLWPEAVTLDARDRVEVGDADGDGRADLIIFAQGEGKVYVSLTR